MSAPALHLRRDLHREALATAAERSRLALGTSCLCLDDLLDSAALADADPAQGRRAPPFHLGEAGQALLLHALCRDARPPLRGLDHSPGLRRSLLRIFQAAGMAALSPALFERLIGRLTRSAPSGTVNPAKLHELARLYARYRALLGPRLLDDGLRFRRALSHLATLASATWPGATSLDVHDMALAGSGREDGLSPWARLQALAVLTGLATPARRALRVILPDVDGHPVLEAALAPVQEALYRLHELDLEEVRVPAGPHATDSDEPYPRFLRALFAPEGAPPLLSPGELPPDQLSVVCAADRVDEALTIARRVRDLVDQGTPAAAIGVVAQSDGQRARLRDALQRYGVPACLVQPLDSGPDRLHSAAHSPLVQTLLGLYALHPSGIPREALIRHLTSVYLSFFDGDEGLSPWHIARALRESGVRDLAAPDYRRRLEEWLREKQRAAAGRRARREASSSNPLIPTADLSLAERHVVPLLERALRLLDSLPASAPVAGHCAALRRLGERTRLAANTARSSDGVPAAVMRRDGQALQALQDLLEELPRAALRLGREQDPLDRAAFAELLAELLAQIPLRSGEQTGAAVAISDLGRLCARRHAHLFVTGLIEGELPSHAPEDSLLTDEERRGLNRLLNGEVFPLSSATDRLTPLWLYSALAHAAAATLSYAASDDDGRPLLRSALIDDVLRAAARPEPPRRVREPVPPLDEVRTRGELWTRAALDANSDLLATPPAARPAAARRQRVGRALLSALAATHPERASRIQALWAVEEQRRRFFAAVADQRSAGDDAEPVRAGPFVGLLQDPELRPELHKRLPGGPRHALSASALEDYAKCPFRFFLRRVLKAAPMLWGGDDLDPMAGGRLHHSVLERFFKERQSSGRLPLRADEDDRRHLELAIHHVLTAWDQEERTGHKALFAVRVQRLREDLQRLIEREAREPLLPGGMPVLFEHKFGPIAIRSTSEPDGLPLSVEGVIDRVDLRFSTLPNGSRVATALVLDYKSGRLERYEGYLLHELLRTSFQLPLYAAAVLDDQALRAASVIVDRVVARYYSVRTGRVSRAELDDQRMIALGPAQALRPDGNVAEVAYHLWRQLRDGDFRVQPRTCEGCGMEAACRITPAAQEGA